jgi:ABC-type bacteriocin/lantibiotic exporter with double-glycine peptidase domain
VKAVVQEERTGCAIACAAMLAGVNYAAAQRAGARLGITAADPSLWNHTGPMRRLLEHFHLRAAAGEKPFASWDGLPDLALLAIKWHRTATGPAWHWVVFTRKRGAAIGCVLDPKRALRTHRRTDFGRMKPKWFITVTALK